MHNIPRLIEAPKSIVERLEGEELKESIRASEGRVIASEVIAISPPLVDGISNAELAKAFGADMIILNMYDINNPVIQGAPSWVKYPRNIFELTGLVVGANLEPIPEEIASKLKIPKGRLAIAENAKMLVENGAKFIVITGNPRTGVTGESIAKAVREIRTAIGRRALIFAGKMHSAGVYEKTVSLETLLEYIRSGADGVLIPAPGTIPSTRVDTLAEIVDRIHSEGGLVISCIGTSQEGADVETIRRIALYGKMIGADIHHIGDSGYSSGIAVPENIMYYSIAIKGRRHTYRRMAMSPLR